MGAKVHRHRRKPASANAINKLDGASRPGASFPSVYDRPIRPEARPAWTIAAAAGPVAFYLLFVLACTWPRTIGAPQSDYYNLLVRGLRKGHLSLDTPVPAELLRSPNPYDPEQRPAGAALGDASLYHDKYYIYFGVTPAVVLLLPFSLLTGHDLPVAYADWFFVSAGYLASLGWFRLMQKRHFPAVRPAIEGAAVLGLALGGAQLVLLARHSLYELPIAAGSAFFLAGLYCWARARESVRSRSWGLAAGLLVGFAAGCRPFYALGIVLFFAGGRWKPLAAAASGWAAVGTGLAVYNAARFGRPWEFGQTYQLSGAIEGAVQHWSWRYVPFNLFTYLLSPLRWQRYFPFVQPHRWMPMPPGFGGWEQAYGLLTNAPFLAFGAALVTNWRRRSLGYRADFGLLIAAAALIFGLLLFFFGSVARYLGDIAPPCALLAACGLATCRPTLPTRWAGWTTAAFTSAIALLIGSQLYNRLDEASPRLYDTLESVANVPIGWAEQLAQAAKGPIEFIAEIPSANRDPQPLLSVGEPQAIDAVWVRRIAPDLVRFLFFHGRDLTAESPPAPLPGGRPAAIAVSLGSLYPPDHHPYFFGRSDRERASDKGWIRVAVDGNPVWATRASFYPPVSGTVTVGKAPDGNVFVGRISSVHRRARWWTDEPLPPRRFFIEFRLSALMGSRSLPLLTMGRSGAGDALVLRCDDNPTPSARIGFDHWGRKMIWSAPFPWSSLHPHRMLVSVGSDRRSLGFPITVAADGVMRWQTEQALYPAEPYQIFPATNAISASSCEATLPGAIVGPAP